MGDVNSGKRKSTPAYAQYKERNRHEPKWLVATKNLLLSVAALLVALVLAEIALRTLDVARPFDLPPRPTQPDLYVSDPEIGYRLWPSTRTCMRYPPNSHRVTPLVSNSDGFASSRELGEPDPRPRVLVLGDSFTFGTGVNEGARFTEIVEEIEPRWRVDNLGMTGWGIDLMVRGLERYGPKAKPAVVVLAVYTDDFRRLDPFYAGVGFPFTKFALQDGALVDVAYPRRTLLDRLRIVELARLTVAKRDRNFFALNEALIDRFQAIARRLHAAPVILFLPGRSDTEGDRERRSRLAGWAGARGIPFRDLTTLIHEPGPDQTFLTDNWHMSERGHRIVGEALHALLASSVLRGAGSEIDPQSLPAPPWRSLNRQYCSDEASAPRR